MFGSSDPNRPSHSPAHSPSEPVAQDRPFRRTASFGPGNPSAFVAPVTGETNRVLRPFASRRETGQRPKPGIRRKEHRPGHPMWGHLLRKWRVFTPPVWVAQRPPMRFGTARRDGYLYSDKGSGDWDQPGPAPCVGTGKAFSKRSENRLISNGIY